MSRDRLPEQSPSLRPGRRDEGETRRPRLDRLSEPATVRAVVLLLHGGQQRSAEPVHDRHASWWRMALLGRRLRPVAERHGWALALLQYRNRGWNDPAHPDPVVDARVALDDLRGRHPGRPIVVLGHSMGGRVACRVADDDAVRGVVALAPWLPENEPVEALVDRDLHVLHGGRDRWTSAQWSREFVDRARPRAREATWTPLPGAGHFMLRRAPAWNRFASDSVRRVLTTAPGTPGVDGGTT